ncbi:MAG: response regulator, partial [Acidobacteriota bacterium]
MTSAIIVDDEPLARERIRSLIEERGDIEIICECRDGKEAVAAIADQRPDLVFL